MVVQLLSGAVDRVLLGVEQMLDEKNQLDLLALIDAIPRSVLRRNEKAKLTLPVAQDVRLETGEIADLANREELLNGIGRVAHASCSERSSRVISSCAASLAG